MNTLVPISEVPCPRCGSERRDYVISVSDYLVEYPEEFDIVECRDCGLAYLSTQPNFEDLMRVFYRDDYISYEEGSWLNRQRELLKHRARQKELAAYVPAGGRVLDIGPGTASMLRAFGKLSDWELHACEPNPALCREPASWGVNMHPHVLEDADFPNDFFDAVTMVHVLEHVPDPVRTINEIHRILKPGGVFLTEQPNFDSAARRLFGKAWWGYHAPRHLTHFTVKTLSEMIAQSDFEIRAVRHPFRPACNPWSCAIRLELLGVPASIARLFGNRSPLFIALMTPLELGLVALKRNDVMELVACKK